MVYIGVKKKSGILDFALFKSDSPCTAAAVFTTNQFSAAPVQLSKLQLSQYNNHIFGVVINSGCANACTGTQGMTDAENTIKYANKLGIQNALVMSTGVIGPNLPMDKIYHGIELGNKSLNNDNTAWQNASKAIMTTDTVNKLVSESYELSDGTEFILSGTAKGAGMIHPNMATMLSVVCCDISIDQQLLQHAVKYAADRSFNNISIDGDTSTNDTFAVLCNHQAGNHKITDIHSSDYQIFQSALTRTSTSLAKQLVLDGEGATKFVSITVANVDTFNNARVIASSISTSALVKTALFGQDANWGRILCATGYAGVKFDSNKVNLFFIDESETNTENNEGIRTINKSMIYSNTTQSLHLVKNGQPYHIDEDIALRLLQQKNIYIYLDLGIGEYETTQWTCDFSYDYVKINADYRS